MLLPWLAAQLHSSSARCPGPSDLGEICSELHGEDSESAREVVEQLTSARPLSLSLSSILFLSLCFYLERIL